MASMSNSLSVGDLKELHEGKIRAASPSNSPQQARRTLPGTGDANGEEQNEAPGSPTPGAKELPDEKDVLARPAPSAGTNGDAGGSTVLGNIQEDAGATDEAQAKQDGGKEGATPLPSATTGTPATDTTSVPDAAAPSAPAEQEGSDTPLASIAAGVEQLPEKEREVVKANLERIAGYPRELPLSASWTLHFSDSSGASKSSSAAATKDAYTEGINPVFTAKDVATLCGSLKAFKTAARRKNARPTDPDSYGLYRAGQNLHFFRSGISPTWEDPYNEKGGRITISPHASQFDAVYERLILLLAGASLEIQTSDLLQNEGPVPGSKRPPTAGGPQEGMINGVVASRRARGDRIELWLGGKNKKEPAPGEWLDRLKQVLAEELEDPALANAKFKKFF